MAKGPEFERVSTTLVNAYVAPRIARYVDNLTDKLRSAGYAGQLLIMQSTGGVMPPDYVARRAVTLLGSGPTGGVMGATVAARAADVSDFVAVDMGGTSYDLCLVRNGRGTGATATTSACRWSTRSRWAPAADRSRESDREHCSSAPSRPGRRPVRSATAAAGPVPP
jgi:N-methylhydantoinase A/oxoprolinase/acetone carboxylase beta subunit